jgi:hypothetical protein
MECSASAIIPDDPVTNAAASFMTAISAFAKSAPTTASINDSFSYEIIAPLDYREKIEAWQWRLGYEFALMKLLLCWLH